MFTQKKNKKLRSEICQRCYFLKEFNIALGVNVSPDEYPKILSQIKNKTALAVLMIDLLDFPCSLWPGILDITGKGLKKFVFILFIYTIETIKSKGNFLFSGHKPVIIVGNKIDLLIQEDRFFKKQIKDSVLNCLNSVGLNTKKVLDICLISAKTGYGVEQLINSIHNNWGTRGIFSKYFNCL